MQDNDAKVLGKQTNEYKGLHLIDLQGKGLEIIQFDTDELIAQCPETGQRDFYSSTITLYPSSAKRLTQTIETKSLKLYLATFADKGVFAENLAGEIADQFYEAFSRGVTIVVSLIQKRRGGIEITAVAQREAARNGQHETE